ncbi:alpha/beta hydrolase [Mycolicibacterium fortuitum]|uniref:alpha/beta hydrolase n=1 Tax=Mycolicibacterium fortuitum TaxID=1766 RepID=UPI002617030E|nr:alpha/beta hydrolase [Mycolicibacterium fortuitum]
MKKNFIWAVVYGSTFFLSFAVAIAACILIPQDFGGVGDVKWDPSMGTIETGLPYADGELNKFDLYLPADRSKNSYKLVLYIHAGGFTGGDKADDHKWGKWFASKGYVGATINYSLRTKENSANVPQMSREIKHGVRAIAKVAADRGYNVDAMAVAGGSAGGTLAMIFAYRDAAESPIPVKAVISMVGPGSFEPAAWFGFDDEDYQADDIAQAGAAFVSMISGDTVTPAMMRSGEYKKVLRPVTPSELVTRGAPATLVAYGLLDKVAPFAASKRLLEALGRNDVPHDAIIFPKSGHALQRDADKARELGSKLNEYLDRYLPTD